MAKRGKRSKEVRLEEMEVKLLAMEEWKERAEKKILIQEEWKERAEKKIWHLQRQLEEYEGQVAKKRRRDKKMEASSSRHLELQFNSQPSPMIYTLMTVKGENSDDFLGLSVVDPLTKNVIPSGPESSMDVELVLVNGDFRGTETGKQKLACFEDNIIKPRSGRPPLLKGDIFLKLNGGSVQIDNLKITDNSIWVSSRRFRLMAKVPNGYLHGMRVKEAITNPFIVKEKRLIACQKHQHPRPEDDVWRLKGIAKNGRYGERLKENGINTVGDFLQKLQENRNGLRDDILKMPLTAWEVTVKHAEACTLRGLTHQQLHPGWGMTQATEVVQQQSVQAVYKQNELVGVSSVAHINSLPHGSSNPGIQKEFSSNHYQFGGSPLLPQQTFPATLHMAVRNDDVTSTSEDACIHVGSGATLSHGAKLPVVDMLHEDIGYQFRTEDRESPESGFNFIEEFLSGLHSLDGGDILLNVPTESTGGKHEAHLKWSTLIVAMAFSVRIVAVNGLQVETPHNA